VYDVPNFGEYWEAANVVAAASIRALQPEFVSFITHGLEVAHAHIHILPRKPGESVFVPETMKLSNEELEETRSKIAAELL
jgi:diadenosine tetraphosphate (Ap4A) HIT family hydrolase